MGEKNLCGYKRRAMKQELTQVSHFLNLGKKDFLSFYILRLVFLPLLFSLLFWGVIFYFFGGLGFERLYELLRPNLALEISWLLWIQGVIDFVIKATLWVFFVILFLVLSLLSNLIICSFLAPLVVKFVCSKHYAHKSLQGDTGLFVSVFYLLKTYVLYFVFLVILIPFYFIPFLGSLLILLPNYWLFSKTLVADVGENIFTQEDFKTIKKEHKKTIRNVILPLYGFSLIPLLNFFIPLYALVVLSHLFLSLKE